MKMAWVFGVDIGQAQDHPALIGNHVLVGRDRPGEVIHRIRYIERLPLGLEYDALIERVFEVLNTAEVAKVKRYVVVDGTGQGRPLVSAFRKRFSQTGVQVIPTQTTRGELVTRGERGWWNIAKSHLVSILRLTLAERRLRIARGLKWSDELKMEMLDFRMKAGKEEDKFEAGAGHDDLVMALALSLWYAEDVVGRLLKIHVEDQKPLKVPDPRQRLSWRKARA